VRIYHPQQYYIPRTNQWD